MPRDPKLAGVLDSITVHPLMTHCQALVDFMRAQNEAGAKAQSAEEAEQNETTLNALMLGSLLDLINAVGQLDDSVKKLKQMLDAKGS